ncbi:MAG: sugar phosphate isomerase/epimerase family protein [bacterium]
MNFGCCGIQEEIEIIKSSGADFIELAVTEIVNSNIERLKNLLDESHLRAYSFNVFLPGDLSITGPSVDIERLQDYVKEALRRVNLLGGKIIVFGSGRARSIPEGFSKEKASEQIVAFLRLVSRYAQGYDIKIAIEPLNRQESNIINTTLEALEFAEAVDNPYVGVLIDTYHADLEGEPLSNLGRIKNKLYHIHVSDRGRIAPGRGNYDFESFFSYLKNIGYNNAISIECRWEDKARELSQSLEYLRKEWKE